MKQLLSLFLFLLPCLAWAQYPSNGNQKITLGEQTTADGLIFRGVLADTGIITPSSDTSAYIILDTVNHRFYNYNRATNVWSVAGGGTSVTTFSAGSTGLTPIDATSGAVTLGGTLAVANGGTGATSFIPNNYLIRTNSSGIFDTSLVYEAGDKVGIGITIPRARLHVKGSGFTNSSSAFKVDNSIDSNLFNILDGGDIKIVGSVNIIRSVFTPELTGNFVGYSIFQNSSTLVMSGGTNGFQFNDNANGAALVNITNNGGMSIANLAGTGSRAVLADANGLLSAPVSSINTKENVKTLNYGLNELLQINPVSFDYINKDKWGEERNLGFIVEDMFPVIPEVTGTMYNGDMYLDMTKLIPVLTKAIQEQNAIIKALEQRIINLENK
jgi:hypothetical protein